MNNVNNPLLAAIVLAGFVWLAYASYRHDHDDAAAYPASSIERLNRMSAHALRSALPAPSLSGRQRAAIMSVWNLKEADLQSTVDIFGEKK